MLLKRGILCYHLNVFGDAYCGVASARHPFTVAAPDSFAADRRGFPCKVIHFR